MFVLVVLLLHGHVWGSKRVHHLWVCPCFSSSVLHVWFVTWIVFVIGGRWPYSWCLLGCCRQDLFKTITGYLFSKAINKFLQAVLIRRYLSIFLRWGIMYIIYIFRTIILIFVAMFITTFRPLYAPAFFRCFECRTLPFISLTRVDSSSFTSHVLWMSVISYLLLISPLKVLLCLHRVLNSQSFGYITGSNQRLYPLYHVSLKKVTQKYFICCPTSSVAPLA